VSSVLPGAPQLTLTGRARPAGRGLAGRLPPAQRERSGGDAAALDQAVEDRRSALKRLLRELFADPRPARRSRPRRRKGHSHAVLGACWSIPSPSSASAALGGLLSAVNRTPRHGGYPARPGKIRELTWIGCSTTPTRPPPGHITLGALMVERGYGSRFSAPWRQSPPLHPESPRRTGMGSRSAQDAGGDRPALRGEPRRQGQLVPELRQAYPIRNIRLTVFNKALIVPVLRQAMSEPASARTGHPGGQRLSGVCRQALAAESYPTRDNLPTRHAPS